MNKTRIAINILALSFLATGLHAQTLLFNLVDSPDYSLFGYAIAGGLDVNADGYDDVIVGAPAENNSKGSVRVYSGNGGSLLHYIGAAEFGHVGHTVVALGDVNQDGYDDFAYGDPGYGQVKGRVTAISGADYTIIFKAFGGLPVNFGEALGTCDINDDGITDVIGAAYDVLSFNHVMVLDGRNGEPLQVIYGDAYTYFGYASTDIGDLNGDGITELLIGAPRNASAGEHPSKALIYDGLTGELIRPLEAKRPKTDWFGQSVAALGDINADKIPDFAVASNYYIRVFSGADLSVIYELYNPGTKIGDMIKLEDIDGDRVPELAVQIRDSYSRQSVRIFSGASGSRLGEIRGEPGEAFGLRLAAGGDLNADGLPDLLVTCHIAGTTTSVKREVVKAYSIFTIP